MRKQIHTITGKPLSILVSICLLLTLSMLGCGEGDAKTASGSDTLTLLAAASTATALDTLINQFESDTRIQVRVSYAASSTLARQIKSGAPADVFLSANTAWMDELAAVGLIRDDTRRNLLSNTLVIIVPRTTEMQANDLNGVIDYLIATNERLAIGDPQHVPVGMYAKQALEQTDAWDRVSDRLLTATDARNALVYVESGEAAAGIVYRTDAASSDRVRIIATLQSDKHDPITYPIAAMHGSSEAAQRFIEYVCNEESKVGFEAAGFTVVCE